MSNNDGYRGTQPPSAGASEYNAQAFVITQLLNNRNHAALVKVIAVNAPGGLALAGTVDVQPLVNQLDGYGNAVPHGVINELMYLRIQGGANGIIMDPKAGDIGICVFCDRDSSAVRASRASSNPGSMRRSDMADGIYIGGVLNGVPNQYVMFTDAGIEIKSPTLVKLVAPEVDIVAPVVKIQASESTTITTPTFTVNGQTHLNGNTSITGNANASGTVTAPNVVGTANVTFGGKSGVSHTHGGVTTGTGTTGGPV